MASLSNEEEQWHLHLTKMMLTVAEPMFREVVNYTINNINPTITFQNILVNNHSKLNLLRKTNRSAKQKIITEEQWKNMFPPAAAGTVSPVGTINAALSNAEFDTTLLMILVRNLENTATPKKDIFNKPKSGWDTISPPTDLTIEDDLKRIRDIRNKMAHRKTIQKNDFHEILTEMFSVTSRLQEYLQHSERWDYKFCEAISAPFSKEDSKYLEDILHVTMKIDARMAVNETLKQPGNNVEDSVDNKPVNIEQGKEPVPPAMIACNKATAAELQLEWAEPEGNPGGYNVIVKLRGDASDKDNEEYTPNTQFTKSGLIPGKAYIVKIQSVYNSVCSRWIEDVFYTEPVPPSHIQRLSEKQDMLEFSWPKPEGHADSFDIIVLHKTNERNVNIHTKLVKERMFTATDLKPGNTYIVKVKSVFFNQLENPNSFLESEPVEAQFSTVPETVKNMRLAARSPNSLNICWDPPVIGHGQAIYIIDIWQKGFEHEQRSHSYEHQYTFPNLKAGIKYCVGVQVKYNNVTNNSRTEREFMTGIEMNCNTCSLSS